MTRAIDAVRELSFSNGERVVGLTQWRDKLVVATDRRVLIYDPLTDIARTVEMS